MIEVAVAHPYLLVIYYLLLCFDFYMSACLTVVSTYAAVYNSFFFLIEGYTTYVCDLQARNFEK